MLIFLIVLSLHPFKYIRIMSVLESIRKRTGLLVGIVGLALVIFILQLSMGNGNGGPSSSDSQNSVGEIDGSSIDVNVLQSKVSKIRADMMRSEQGSDLTEAKRTQSINQAWDEIIREQVYNKQYEKLGIVCSDEELTDQMLIHPHSIIESQFRDQNTQKITKEFANPDGTLNVKELNKLVSQFKPEQTKMWADLEKYVAQTRLMEKYTALVKYGLYVTTSEAKMLNAAQNTNYDVKFVLKKYSSILDSTVKVNDSEIEAYYNDHLYDFQNDIPARSLEYIAWDVVPSAADLDTLKVNLERVAIEFKSIKADEDTAFTQSENDGKTDISSYSKDKMSPEIDSSFFTSPVGTVFGPFRENNTFKVIKLRGTEQINDSAKVRHILISLPSEQNPAIKRTAAQSKSLADSLVVLLKKDIKRFDEFVKKYSDDPGKNRPDYKANPQILNDKRAFPKAGDSTVWTGKGGNYGWLNDGSSFVPEFKNFGLQGKKNDVGIAVSQFGFHVMEVMEVSKTSKTKYKIATVSSEIKPSDITRQDYLQKASDFAGLNNSSDKFHKGAEAIKLALRLQEDLKEGDPFIAGFQNPNESPKEVIRWVFKSEIGNVSSPFSIGDKIVVALVTKIKEKGATALEFLKDEITAKVRDAKKAEILIKELTEKSVGCKTINDIVKKTGLTVEGMDKLQFMSYSVPVYGKEDELVATACVTKKGSISKAGKGTAGVWIVAVNNVTPAPIVKDYKESKNLFWQGLSGRAAYEPMDALKKAANIEDHKARFDY